MSGLARRTWGIACILLLAGCAGTGRPPEPAAARDWAQRQAQLAALTYWTASGKIALRTAREAESASLRWEQSGNDTHLELSGPLGVAATTVDSDGQYLAIRRGEEYRRWSLTDPQLGQANHWDLPLASLHYWLKGIAAPDAPVQELALDPATQLPQTLQQQGWTVEYQGFGRFGDYQLPTRLQVQRDSTRARILLRDWRLRDKP